MATYIDGHFLYKIVVAIRLTTDFNESMDSWNRSPPLVQSLPQWAALRAETGWIFAPKRMRESAATSQIRFCPDIFYHVCSSYVVPNEALDNSMLCPHPQNYPTHQWPHHFFTLKNVGCSENTKTTFLACATIALSRLNR